MDSELLRLIIVNAPGVGILLFLLMRLEQRINQQTEFVEQLLDECLSDMRERQSERLEQIVKHRVPN